MSTMLIDIPDDLVHRLQSYSNYLPTILEIGLEQFDPGEFLQAEATFSAELDSIIDFLHSSPPPESIIGLRASKALQARISELLEKNRNEGLSAAETAWWEKFEYVEHLTRLAKAKALSQVRP